jgi:hypothetical protein
VQRQLVKHLVKPIRRTIQLPVQAGQVNQGTLLLGSRRIVEAEEHLANAIKLTPGFALAHNLLKPLAWPRRMTTVMAGPACSWAADVCPVVIPKRRHRSYGGRTRTPGCWTATHSTVARSWWHHAAQFCDTVEGAAR